MYKVFIENRPIIFTESVFSQPNCVVIPSQSILDIESDLLSQLGHASPEQPIVVECHALEKEFDRIFKHYEKLIAAGGIVQNAGNCLGIKRNGLWDLPKGIVEKGESLENAALREIEEECGVTGLKITGKITETYHTYLFQGKNVLKHTHWYLVHCENMQNLVPQTEEGITEVKWISTELLENVFCETFASIKEVLSSYSAIKDEKMS